jgi:DNA-binding LytR/AlgR family response regulator
MRALIVDDEPLARMRLIRLLEGLGGVEIVGEAADGLDALERIATDEPDVVFLDISMPGLDGLSLALGRDDLPPIVFTTAHGEHAAQAFDSAAVDYLLKPIERARLERALERVKTRRGSHDVASSGRRTLRDESDARAARVCVHERGDLHLFDARTIPRFFASAKYTVFLHEGAEHFLEESLGELERRLVRFGFFRTHRGELVNLHHVRTLRSDESSTSVVLSDGQQARVSRRLIAELKRALGVD